MEPMGNEPERPNPEWRDRLPTAGLLLSWIAGVLTACQVAAQTDLLEAVLRGGCVWLAAALLWLLACHACRPVLSSDSRSSATSQQGGEAEELIGDTF
jgi:hypothetical protein